MSTQRILSSQLPSHTNKQVTIQGWLHKKRELSKNLVFLVIRDRKGLTQVVVTNSNTIHTIHMLKTGSVLEIYGEVKKEEKAPNGIEIIDPEITVLVSALEDSPIEIDKTISHQPEHYSTLFEYRAIGLRSIKEQAVFYVYAQVLKSIRSFLDLNEFTEFKSPKLLAEATEGGSEVFTLEYFGKKATLAQSAQFYKQMMVGVFERAYEVGATYRAEPSFTPRHMTEFTTVDVEMGFIETFDDVLSIAESLLHSIVEDTWTYGAHYFVYWSSSKPVISQKIPRVSLSELHNLYLMETGIDYTAEKDPKPEEEKFISMYAAQHWHSEAVFITEFPATDMKFYHYKNQENPEVCNRADLIFRGVEIATLSQREHRYDVLVQQLKSIGADVNNPGFTYYLQAFKYGLPPHGGFGLGLERVVQKLLGLQSVKEAALFPRDANRLSP